jgi:hypothetical protein
VQVWSELDPQASCFIQAIQLSTLIQELLPPLGVKGEQDARAKIQGIIMNVDIPVRNGKVQQASALLAYDTEKGRGVQSIWDGRAHRHSCAAAA